MESIVTNSAQIEGVVVTPLSQFSDARGSVLHMLRCDAADFGGFGECYFSEVLPGAVKAWKCHRLQTQNLAVPVGRIRLVIYDDRDGVRSRGRIQIVELGRPDGYVRVHIPPGLWYGFTCISVTPALLANCADLPHDPTETSLRAVDDPTIPYKW